MVTHERAGSPDSRVATTPQRKVELPLPQRQRAVEPPDDDAVASKVTVMELPAPATPIRTEALAPSQLVAATAGSSGPALTPIHALGPTGDGLAASRVSVVEQLRRDFNSRQTERGEVLSLLQPADLAASR